MQSQDAANPCKPSFNKRLVSQVEQLVKDYKASSSTLAHPTRMRGHVRREGDGGESVTCHKVHKGQKYNI